MDQFKSFVSDATSYSMLNFGQSKKRVLVIKGIPPAEKKEQREIRDQVLNSLCKQKIVPVVIIHTVFDAPTINSSLYREFPKEFLNNSIQIDLPGFSETQMKDKIDTILRAERKGNREMTWNDKDIASIVEKADGDMSFAINQIEMFSRGSGKTFHTKEENLDIHHAAARILYGKNEPGDKEVGDQVHVPYDVLISYVHGNMTEFCTDIDDIATIMSNFSTSDLFFSRWLPGNEHIEQNIWKYGYLIAYDAYIAHNKHKPEKKFHHVKAPLIKQVFFESRGNQRLAKKLFQENNAMIEYIPFYKRMPNTMRGVLSLDQINFLNSVHHYTFRNGSTSSLARKSGDHDKECEEIIEDVLQIEM